MDYLVVPVAEDGTWYDEPDTAVGLEQARKLARGKWEGRVPNGYDVVIYSYSYVEAVDFPKPAAD